MSKLIEQERWQDIDKLLLETGPYAPSEFEGSEELKQMFFENAKVLIVGAGGLGCEILKDLALMGFKDLHIIDLDTIDVTNLNRQFLFRKTDVGKNKSDVAAKFVEKRVPGCKVTPYVKKIQEFDKEFYEQFQIIVAGLDNIEARRWLNTLVHSLVQWEDGKPDPATIRPLVDGGTEGFKGQSRVIMPFTSACFECTLATIPRGNVYNFCTIAKTPRIAEHCIAYAQMILWEENFPDRKYDTDSVEDMEWLYQKALARAAEFGIQGVTFKLTQGVIKNIIPAIASTNALISAACCNEVFKLMTGSSRIVDNYMMFLGHEGINTSTMKMEPLDDCSVCKGLRPKTFNLKKSLTLAEFIEWVKTEDLKLENPAISSKTLGMLYMSNKNFAQTYAGNLTKTLGYMRILSLNHSEFLEKDEGKENLELFIDGSGNQNQIRVFLKLE